jgi:hypothetical protein
MKVRDSDVLGWVRGQRKMSHVLGAFGLLEFTMLRPHSRLARVFKLMNRLCLDFSIFISGRFKPRETETADTESVNTGARLYIKTIKE